MFSGNFSEKDKQEISIDVVDANSMSIIVRYMRLGLIDLAELSLPTIGELAIAANFLQITELIKQIEYCLELQLSKCNWLEIMAIAENASYKSLEQRCAAYGLYDFKLMKAEFIESINKLVWYLSHTHLNSETELQVFKFGVDWIIKHDKSADALLLILGCLDVYRLKEEELKDMKILVKHFQHCLAEKVIDCLYTLATDCRIICCGKMNERKKMLCEMYTERIYMETFNLVNNSKKRQLKFKPCVAVWSRDPDPDMLDAKPHYLYTINNMNEFEPWLEVTEMCLWGWKFVAWGITKIVIVCGERRKGTGFFWKGVKIYDALKKEWIEHGVELPIRRHGGVAIVDDSLYIIGGVGGYRVVLDTAIVYDLKQRNYRKIAKFPDAIQSPAVCVYNRKVYASSHKNIYRYEDDEVQDKWVIALETDIRLSCMVSYKGYIYCTQSYFNDLYRFRPNVDTRLQRITSFDISPSTMCLFGNKLLAFESTDATQLAKVNIEEYDEDSEDRSPKLLWSRDNSPFIINDVAGSCAVVDSAPPLATEISDYVQRRLEDYHDCYSK
ncbi:unnamed protein product [Arctia plantaginis]|uniref:BACK domain-containing protein n=1 Tax=Arctia plantaginis TaxID=874455 RepID=A0A8S1ALA5_ARCPL|nr:unnamed protein product [Arctia plantaginis]